MRVARLVGLVLFMTGVAQADPAPEQPNAGESAAASPAAAPSVGAAPSSAAVTSPAVPSPPAVSPSPSKAELKRMMKQAIKEYEEEQRAAWRAKTVRRHDGFYLRFGLDLGYAIDRASLRGSETRSRGFGAFLDYWLGLNVSESVVLAAGLHSVGVFSPTTTVDGAPFDVGHTAFYALGGVLLDYYPNPRRGFHVCATLGSASANIKVEASEDTRDGIGVGLGAGYDFWVGEQWSLGSTVRMLYLGGPIDDFGSHRTLLPTLALTALFH